MIITNKMHKFTLKQKKRHFSASFFQQFLSVLSCFSILLIFAVKKFVKFFHFFGIEVYYLKSAGAVVYACAVFVDVLYYFLAFPLTHIKSLSNN